MSIYHYKDQSVIDEVTFRTNAKGSIRAYLHARPGTDLPTVQTILNGLGRGKMESIPYTLDGKPVLEVRGFKHEGQLTEYLSKNNWVSERPSSITSDQKIGFIDKIKKRSLQASGAFYVIGDVNFFTYGRKKSSWEDMTAGVMYALGTWALLGYGKNDQSLPQIKDISKKILRHAAKANILIPKESALNQLGHDEKKDLAGGAHELLKRYPSEIFNLFTGLAGAFITASALRHKVIGKPPGKGRISGLLDVGLGTITMASTAIGGLVDEKVHDPDQPKEQGVQAVLDWVRERPLTIAGIGLMISTGLHGISTFMDFHAAKKSGNHKEAGAIKNRAIFVLTNLAAEFLITISSKGHGEGVVSDTSVDTSVISVAAELIACQPEKHREELIQYMGKFLGGQNVLAMKDEEVVTSLREQVNALCANPWVQCHDMNSTCAPQQAKPAAVSGWQAKLASESPASPQLSA